MTHQCPGPACQAEVSASELLCPGHWRQVPAPVRRAVQVAWNRGGGAGTPAHRAAVRLAVAVLTREVVPASSLKHPARGSAVESLPRTGPVSPASTRRCVTDEQ